MKQFQNILEQNLRIPSPTTQVFFHWKNTEFTFDVKRDDLIHPIISGNKFRKLFGFLKKYDGVYKEINTFGGAYSNHLPAVAACGAVLNKKTTAYVRGEISKDNQVMAICRLLGMKIMSLPRKEFDEMNDEILKLSGNLINDVLHIPMGGAGDLGRVGVSEMMQELKKEYHHIICGLGTGTTALGMAAFIISHQLQTKIHLFPSINDSKLLEQLAQNNELLINQNYAFGGYAKVTEELIFFVQEFCIQTGILLDPIYTAKSLYGFLDLCLNDFQLYQNKSILLYHSGGLSGWNSLRNIEMVNTLWS